MAAIASTRQDAPAGSAALRPVFVVGAPGAGTAAVHAGLVAHPSFWGRGTGDFLAPLFVGLPQAHRYHTAQGRLDWLAAQRVSYPELARHVGVGVADLFARHAGDRRWVDDSPVYGRMLPELAMMFPAADVVFVNRDGREVAAALGSRHPDLGHAAACRLWQRYADAWRRSGAAGLRLVEARFDLLAADPAGQLDRILRFLGASLDDGAVTTLRKALAAEDEGRWNGWSLAARAEFLAIAGPELRALGFAADDAWAQAG